MGWTWNPVDDCWRCDPNWAAHRQSLANCAIVFGRNAIGGKNGRIYVVTSPADDHVVNPRPGTLRYALIRLEPLWSKYKTFFLDLHTCPPAGDQTIAHEYSIQSCNNELLQLIRLLLLLLGICLTIIFARSMTIRRRNEGIMMSYKRLDGRGVVVHITSGASLTLQSVNHTVIHNIYIHDIVANGPARVMSSESHVGQGGRADGDAISIFTPNNIWIDHCSLAKAADGLIDAIRGSTLITISNNYFMNHDKAWKQP
jgi:pectate lyase